MIEPRDHRCPLCGGGAIAAYHRDKARDYLNCGVCRLVFVPSHQHLSALAEKAHYDLHENDPDDAGYRRFLERLFAPLHERLAPRSRGLDFGCGPGPTLSRMFEEAGHAVTTYDPFYAPDPSVFDTDYDFITLSEVAEHLAAPGRELDHLWSHLRPGGWLGIMTKQMRDRAAFRTWHYIQDPTHVAFFSEATFRWLAEHWSAQGSPVPLIFSGSDVALLRRN